MISGGVCSLSENSAPCRNTSTTGKVPRSRSQDMRHRTQGARARRRDAKVWRTAFSPNPERHICSSAPDVFPRQNNIATKWLTVGRWCLSCSRRPETTHPRQSRLATHYPKLLWTVREHDRILRLPLSVCVCVCVCHSGHASCCLWHPQTRGGPPTPSQAVAGSLRYSPSPS